MFESIERNSPSRWVKTRHHPGKYHVYGKQSAEQKRNELIIMNLKLVSFFVSRLTIGLPSIIDKRDIVCAGVNSLINAARQYNTAIGNTFETYAAKLILGAILDELQVMDWVPHSIIEDSKRVKYSSVR